MKALRTQDLKSLRQQNQTAASPDVKADEKDAMIGQLVQMVASLNIEVAKLKGGK